MGTEAFRPLTWSTSASGASDNGSMTTLVRPLPFPGDPLIREARRRMRRRRVVGVALLILVAAIAAVTVTASRPPAGHGSAGYSRGRQVQQSNRIARVDVPLDATERQWRAWVLSQSFGIRVGPRLDLNSVGRRVEAAVAASGASVVRLKLWNGDFRTPPVELVVAAAHPALYLRHRLDAVLTTFDHGYLYVQVVNRHGAKILEWMLRARMGSIYVRPALFGCSPVVPAGFLRPPPACPVK